MPPRKREEIRLSPGQTWDVVDAKPAAARRGAALTGEDPFLKRLEASQRLTVVDVKTLRSTPRRGIPTTLDLEMEADPDTAYMVMARHESGAIVFVKPSLIERRSLARGTASTLKFSIPVPQSTPEDQQRRSVVGKVIKAAVLKVVSKVAEKSMPLLSKLCETGVWKVKKLHEGWKAVSPGALLAARLPDATLSGLISTDPAKRNLLFIHGTFSHAASAFSALANTRGSDGKTLFESLQPLYADRIFAFDHFTISRTVEENARALLERLPKGPCVFDVITHSRGGLVLRTLVEMTGSLGPNAARFQLGRAVLVASPNEGTPLASPNRFEQFLNWLSNVIDLFPENPFTTAVGFIADALAWVAHAVQVDIPGLAVMNSQGPVIHQLQLPPGPPPKAYSSLVANFEPDKGLMSRMLDVGVDLVFQTANDLVVPTEGGWRVDPAATPLIPGDQIACFGRGGNLANPTDGAVTHISFFSRPASVDFLVQSLLGKPHGISGLDPGTHLPYLLRRGAMAALPPAPAPLVSVPSPSVVIAPPQAAVTVAPVSARVATYVPVETLTGTYADEVFYLSVLGSDDEYKKTKSATLLATFRNARALVPMRTHGDIAGKQFHDIIQKQKEMHAFVNGDANAKPLPTDAALIDLGKDIFETLFPGEVRRLYDAARTAQPNGRLNLIFTSMISWIADLPWEFAYDPERKNFLATSEVNFTRNVGTAIPADLIPSRDHLRILVVVAQPVGLAHLSVDDETAVIKEGFQSLIAAGLAEVDVLLDATPALLHQTLEVSQPYDILHFIGHGEFNEATGLGCLIFENENQGVQAVDSHVLQQIVCRRGVRLMFLNACETGKGGKADFNRGVAPALVAGGVPVIVANQFSVLDVTATDFAKHFYWAIAQGQSVGDAAREARVAVNYLISGEAIDWAVPVVFARNPADRLATEKRAAGERVISSQKERVADRRARRSVMADREERRVIMGLWDVQHTIPRLDAITARLTAVQDAYIFKTVSFVAPLGTWQREKSEDVAYLNAPRVAQRLHDKPKELGLQRLVAITSFAVCDDKTHDLYIWDEDVDKRISVVSTHGYLEDLKPPFDAEHMIANTLAFLIGGLEAHEEGPEDCAFYYNKECAIESIAGRLNVCSACRKQLNKDPGTAKVIEKILRAYS